jgi:hypothetical protein
MGLLVLGVEEPPESGLQDGWLIDWNEVACGALVNVLAEGLQIAADERTGGRSGALRRLWACWLPGG